MVQKKSAVAKTIEYGPLTRKLTRSDIQQFLTTQGIARNIRFAKILVSGVGAVFVLVSIPTFFSNDTGSIAGGLITMLIVGVVIAAVFLIEYGYAKAVKLSQFAAANGWYYTRRIANPPYNGMIFQQGYGRHTSNTISMTSTETIEGFEMGDYEYTTGSGKNRQVHNWFYMCVEMDRQLPHMVLDSRANNLTLFGKDIATNLPASFSKDQVLRLEGDFNDHFTLYAPKEYERDALYVFTPDLMALLIDSSHAFDAEIIDNKLYFYQKYRPNWTDPAVMYQLLTIINTVGMKLYRQTDYYADERVGNRAIDTVAQGGRRLKHGINWFVIIVFIVICMIWIVPSFMRSH